MFGIGTPPQANSPNPEETYEHLPTTLRRPPSYSDSFFVLHGAGVTTEGSLNTEQSHGRSRASSDEEGNALLRQLLHHVRQTTQEKLPMTPRAYLFLIKTAIHIFAVS